MNFAYYHFLDTASELSIATFRVFYQVDLFEAPEQASSSGSLQGRLMNITTHKRLNKPDKFQIEFSSKFPYFTHESQIIKLIH